MYRSIEQGFEKAGIQSIAGNIKKRLHDLEKTIEDNQGRWIWELLQNAKDLQVDSDKKVSIQIEFIENSIEFRHNGRHFCEEDIIGLINQITSKETSEGQRSKQIGRFGTGFLTTHLLSRTVNVKGFFEEKNGDFYKFSVPLDRNAKTTEALIPKISAARKNFLSSLKPVKKSKYNADAFNTIFAYPLNTSKNKKVAKVGIEELTTLLPLVLTFIPTIQSVELIFPTKSSKIKYENNGSNGNFVNELKVTRNGKSFRQKILFLREDDITIATLIESKGKGYCLKDHSKLPKIFCDFPLMGTEDFSFPVIVSCPRFNPMTERNGIWLKGEDDEEVQENKQIIETAVELYKELLTQITERQFYDYYQICQTKTPSIKETYFDINWYKSYVQNNLRKTIASSKVVETESGKKIQFNQIKFPDPELNPKDRALIWKFSSDLKNNILPKLDHVNKWAKLLWDDVTIIDIETLCIELSDCKNYSQLAKCLKYNNKQTVKWMNDAVKFIYRVGEQSYFDDYKLLPDQCSNFGYKSQIHFDIINSEPLKEVAYLLGIPIYSELLDKGIDYQGFLGESNVQTIATSINQKLSYNNQGSDYKEAILKLLGWFERNTGDAQKYFPYIYEKRAELFMKTIEDKQNLYRLMRSKIPFSKLADLADEVKNDPEILNLLRRRKEEKLAEKERNNIGELIENLLKEALTEYGLEVNKEFIGKDLVIQLKGSSKNYCIEVKSTVRKSFVSMTPTQADTAVKNFKNYALCVVYKAGKVNKQYIVENAKFITDIGVKLKSSVNEIGRMISDSNDFGIHIESGAEYKFKISENVWNKGKNFHTFINSLKSE